MREPCCIGNKQLVTSSYNRNGTKRTQPWLSTPAIDELDWTAHPTAVVAGGNNSNRLSCLEEIPSRPHHSDRHIPLLERCLSLEWNEISKVTDLSSQHAPCEYSPENFSDDDQSDYDEDEYSHYNHSPVFTRKESCPYHSSDDLSLTGPPPLLQLTETDHSSGTLLDFLDTKQPACPLHSHSTDKSFQPLSSQRQLSFTYDMDRSFGSKTTAHEPVTTTNIEIAPGVYKPLRGANRTWTAIRNNTITATRCIPCDTYILTIDEVKYVICPICRIVSGTEGNNCTDDAVGLGFSFDDLDQWRCEIRMGAMS